MIRRKGSVVGAMTALALVLTGCVELPGPAPQTSPSPVPSDSPAGWGPPRDLFTTDIPADFASMNSITDNPAHGFEPNFFQVRRADESNQSYSNAATLEPGVHYVGYVYYANSAAENVVGGTAEGVRLSLALPALVEGTAHANAIITGSNTTPVEVWSSIDLRGSGDGAYAIRYVPGSATIHTFGATNGSILEGDALFSQEGALLGCDALDGRISGEPRCAGFVTFEFVADQPNFSIDLTLRTENSGDFGDQITAAPGDTVSIRMVYSNTGTTQQNNVVLVADMIAGAELVPASLKIMNASNPNGALMAGPSEAVFDGINIGHYTPGSNAIVVFQVRIARTGALECGGKWLFVNARAETNNGYKNAGEAIIDVEAVC